MCLIAVQALCANNSSLLQSVFIYIAVDLPILFIGRFSNISHRPWRVSALCINRVKNRLKPTVIGLIHLDYVYQGYVLLLAKGIHSLPAIAIFFSYKSVFRASVPAFLGFKILIYLISVHKHRRRFCSSKGRSVIFLC